MEYRGHDSSQHVTSKGASLKLFSRGEREEAHLEVSYGRHVAEPWQCLTRLWKVRHSSRKNKHESRH